MSDSDRQWFLEQVEAVQAGFRAYIRSLGIRSSDVDDFAQEALLIAWKKLDQFNRNDDFGTWVRAIGRRQIANERRKRQRQQRILSDELTAFFAARQPEQVSPLVSVERKEQLTALRACLGLLSEKNKELVQLRWFQQLSPSVMASYLDQRSGAIRVSLLRLRESLLICVQRRLLRLESLESTNG